jgi:hypothetical protein
LTVARQRQVRAAITPYTVRACLQCGDPSIETRVDGRVVTTICGACLAIFSIEFDPPDAPGLRARIERLDDPDE